MPWGKAEKWGSLCATVFCELCTSTEARALSFSVLELRVANGSVLLPKFLLTTDLSRFEFVFVIGISIVLVFIFNFGVLDDQPELDVARLLLDSVHHILVEKLQLVDSLCPPGGRLR